MSDQDDKKLPQGRFSRFTKMASVGLRSGANLLLKRDGGAAQHAAEVLGQLRGLAAKMGQMAGYVDGLIPEDHREGWEGALSVLQAAAPRSSSREIRLVLEEELRAPVDKLFASFEDEPIASASIGQVHRARLPESMGGMEVAIKVQHPGIAKAIESDLKNAGMLESMVSSLGGRRLNSAQVLAAVRERFREELDYTLEAKRMELFRALTDSQIRIAKVVPERSSARVLTTEFIHGLRFTEACAKTPEERRAWGETMWRFLFRGNLVLGQFNADPHPGNYFFHEGGAVTFLDFGCVNPLSMEQLGLALAAHRNAIDGNEKGFHDEVKKRLGTKPGRLEEPSIAYVRACFEPLFSSPFHITRAYAASLVEGMKEMGKLALRTPEPEQFQMPNDMIFMNRVQFGLYSVLARLDVEIDYSGIERHFWGEVEQANQQRIIP